MEAFLGIAGLLFFIDLCSGLRVSRALLECFLAYYEYAELRLRSRANNDSFNNEQEAIEENYFIINEGNDYPIIVLGDISLLNDFLTHVSTYLGHESKKSITDFHAFVDNNKIQFHEVLLHIQALNQLFTKDYGQEATGKASASEIIEHIYDNYPEQDVHWWSEEALDNPFSKEVSVAVLETILKSRNFKFPRLETSFAYVRIFNHSSAFRMACHSCENLEGQIRYKEEITKFPHHLGCTCLAVATFKDK